MELKNKDSIDRKVIHFNIFYFPIFLGSNFLVRNIEQYSPLTDTDERGVRQAAKLSLSFSSLLKVKHLFLPLQHKQVEKSQIYITLSLGLCHKSPQCWTTFSNRANLNENLINILWWFFSLKMFFNTYFKNILVCSVPFCPETIFSVYLKISN